MEKNKKRESCTKVTSNEQYSPVNNISPLKPTQGKNLTGLARHIRDLTADIHACIQHWNDLHLSGITLLKEITVRKQDEAYPACLQELCDKLEIVCCGLEDVVSNLGQIAYQLKVTASLNGNLDKPFSTWQGEKFGQVAEMIHEAYAKEAMIKRKLLEGAAHYSIESCKMMFLATWVHQPFLKEELTTRLESMLIETGHR